jgi:hypothetical protein
MEGVHISKSLIGQAVSFTQMRQQGFSKVQKVPTILRFKKNLDVI